MESYEIFIMYALQYNVTFTIFLVQCTVWPYLTTVQFEISVLSVVTAFTRL